MIKYEKAGPHAWHCPFHMEPTPSIKLNYTSFKALFIINWVKLVIRSESTNMYRNLLCMILLKKIMVFFIFVFTLW